MPAVFVHGNPETSDIWSLLVEQLEREDVVLLSPPGFGAPVPAGFGGTANEYRDWLHQEVLAIDAPIDLVGHDWGGGHVLNLMMHHPELVRSWCSDIAGIFHPDYVWHDAAQIWQTPEAGEENLAGLVGAGADFRAARFAEIGMSPAIAAAVAEAVNEDMARMVLALYRSAAQPFLKDAGALLPNCAARPGLVMQASEDTYVGTEEMVRGSAERAGAQVKKLEGVGHWWMIQDPAAGAAALEEFWASL